MNDMNFDHQILELLTKCNQGLLCGNVMQSVMRYQQAIIALSSDPDFAKDMELYTAINSELLTSVVKFWSNLENLQFFQLRYTALSTQLQSEYQSYFRAKNKDSLKLPVLDEHDRRFLPIWHETIPSNILVNFYSLLSQSINDTFTYAINGEILDEHTIAKARFFINQCLYALSPSNFATLNPTILHKTLDSNGENLLKGADRFYDDCAKYRRVLSVNVENFELGKNLAITPGKVVYKNEMFELIQYTATTKTVKEIPILITTAWINKYYILDLSQKNSFVEWLVQKGHTVFMISWVNPKTADYANTPFSAYLERGFLVALSEVMKITDQPKVNCIGYCLGGTLLAIAISYLQTKGLQYINSSTFFTALIDFTQCGEVSVFIDDVQIEALSKHIEKNNGLMSGKLLFNTFSFLRANDMIWSYWVNNYLLGRSPVSLDLLYWNNDSANLPGEMHLYYLRKFYQRNLLVQPGKIQMLGVPIELQKIDLPIYVLAAGRDHIAPWESVFKAMQIYEKALNKRFCLTDAGHVAGVVNHPNSDKGRYFTNESMILDPKEWKEKATEKAGSWWVDWYNWFDQNKLGGKEVLPRQLDPSLMDAPGQYVKVQI